MAFEVVFRREAKLARSSDATASFQTVRQYLATPSTPILPNTACPCSVRQWHCANKKATRRFGELGFPVQAMPLRLSFKTGTQQIQ